MDNSLFKLNRPRRSALYSPAANSRALEKAEGLDCDVIIFDLEDSVAPDAKGAARENLRSHFAAHPHGRAERLIRINRLDSDWGTEDFLAARACHPDGLVLPKVEEPSDVLALVDALTETDAPPDMVIFAMIETARGLMNLSAIAELGRLPGARLAGLIVGMNDIIMETRLAPAQARANAHPWLMQCVLAARAGGLDVLDAVYNDFRDAEGFAVECHDGAEMGFNGKTLIHPSQIATANLAFSPSEAALVEAQAIVEAFRDPANAGRGVIVIDGTMVERLHLQQAEALLARAAGMRGALAGMAATETG